MTNISFVPSIYIHRSIILIFIEKSMLVDFFSTENIFFHNFHFRENPHFRDEFQALANANIVGQNLAVRHRMVFLEMFFLYELLIFVCFLFCWTPKFLKSDSVLWQPNKKKSSHALGNSASTSHDVRINVVIMKRKQEICLSPSSLPVCVCSAVCLSVCLFFFPPHLLQTCVKFLVMNLGSHFHEHKCKMIKCWL